MSRILFGIIVGIVLTLFLVFGNYLPKSANAQDATDSVNLSDVALTAPVRQAMLSPFENAINESANTDSGRFLDKLFHAYSLENLPQADQTGTTLLDMLPDIKRINEKAINLPLSAAGKGITDKEIAGFYYDYLNKSGFNVTAADGTGP